MGCSEILTTQITLDHFREDEVFFCTAKDGRPCGSCPKCFRRACIRDYLQNKKADFFNYDNPQVHSILNKSPIYFGHIYSTLIADGWTPPSFALDKLTSLPSDSIFALRYNPESLDFMPDEIREYIKSKLDKKFTPMNTTELKMMKSWDQIK